MQPIAEADWKVFRDLMPAWQARFCRRTLDELASLCSEQVEDDCERYQKVHAVLRERDKELSRAFNDLRRSTATLQLLTICSLGLVTEEERGRFSREMMERVEGVLTFAVKEDSHSS